MIELMILQSTATAAIRAARRANGKPQRRNVGG